MRFASKLVGLVLIAATTFVTGAEADVASKPLAGRSERTVGCHAHDSGAPSNSRAPVTHSRLPAPISYQCCLTGHDAAVLRASHFAQPHADVSCVHIQAESVLVPSPIRGMDFSIALSAVPPGATPLRI